MSLNVYLCIHVCPECLFLYPFLCYSEFMIFMVNSWNIGDHSTAPASSDDLSILGTRCWSCNLWGAPRNEGIMNLLRDDLDIFGWSWIMLVGGVAGFYIILHHHSIFTRSSTKQRLACSNGWWLHWRYLVIRCTACLATKEVPTCVTTGG